MASKKTSAEKAREEEKNAAADDMFGGAFGGLDQMDAPAEESQDIKIPEKEETETPEPVEDNPRESPSGPPSGRHQPHLQVHHQDATSAATFNPPSTIRATIRCHHRRPPS